MKKETLFFIESKRNEEKWDLTGFFDSLETFFSMLDNRLKSLELIPSDSKKSSYIKFENDESDVYSYIIVTTIVQELIYRVKLRDVNRANFNIPLK